jgi:Terminase large subunit, T4likevirus-type, N-terminal
MIVSLKPAQSSVFACDSRFRVLAAGRRFGKTYLGCTELCRAAWGKGRLAWYVAPTYKQGKRIAWNPLKQMTRKFWASPPNETDLRIELTNGGTIALRGADNYDALRGDGLDFVVLDEYASMAPSAWTEVLRPALADKQGGALFIGTPRGHNHFFDLYETAQNQPHWAAFQYTTEQGGNVTHEELQSATHELDERTYRQEFQASFENLGVGLAYYAFERAHNIRPVKYDGRFPIFWALDFNMNPLCSVLGHEHDGMVHVFDELILPDSHTLAACEEFLARTRSWSSGGSIHVYVYGDATGEARKTSASRTDWQIVRDFFGRYPERFHARLQVPSANPPVKDRINCVNARLRNHADQRRLLINPNCKHLIKDLEQVCWKADPHGSALAELDKSDPLRTHVSDALGYFVAREFPMRATFGERGGPPIL